MFDRLRHSFVYRLWLVTGCGIALMLALVGNALYHSREQHIEQLLLVEGAVPGAKNSYVTVRHAIKAKAAV